MKASCCWCTHYCQKSRLVTTGVRDVSGNLAKFRRWSKHRCSLRQEDRYPNNCDFEKNVKLWKELEERYPDLAFAHRQNQKVSKEVLRIKMNSGKRSKIMETNTIESTEAFRKFMDLDRFDALIERHPGTPEETLESAGCTGGCPMYPGAPKTEDGCPDCTKCPEFTEE